MSTSNKNDRLADLYVDPSNASKASELVADINNPQIREIFADLIEAKVSDTACRKALKDIIDLDPEAAKVCLDNFAFSNSSALRQSLAKGFDLPTTGKRASVTSTGL